MMIFKISSFAHPEELEVAKTIDLLAKLRYLVQRFLIVIFVCHTACLLCSKKHLFTIIEYSVYLNV